MASDTRGSGGVCFRLSEVPGFRTAAMHCGLKTAPARPPDLAILYCEQDAAAAGVFTTNAVCAAPVKVSRRHIEAGGGRVRAVVVNAGCANACTGDGGMADALAMCRCAGERLGVPPARVLVASTGVIGRRLPMDRILPGIEVLAGCIAERKCTGDFERAIMTTDLVPKTAATSWRAGRSGATVRIVGACKGSGMIAPRMATMLAFIVTDARISPAALRSALRDGAADTFNAVTVDGDTSTNDTALILASGLAGIPLISAPRGPAYGSFRDALLDVCDSLARQIAADGEGAGKLITVAVGGAASRRDAEKAARAIAESPLVKTAMAGCDPNWGRIIAAAGRSGARFDERRATVQICGRDVFRNGEPVEFDRKEMRRLLARKEVSILLMAGSGPGAFRMYTCDLTHGYITINAEYHT
ncbi:MAG: bifunctional glutamate N-acetyltransferase/amino-acid acetyltransferase ArgJ [Planctomycetota bacterium]|nr:bifunctional glutamate N-acetyltransferase/amino-acid acetyltransferase ArgJ [Planctomycetota bacterium]